MTETTAYWGSVPRVVSELDCWEPDRICSQLPWTALSRHLAAAAGFQKHPNQPTRGCLFGFAKTPDGDDVKAHQQEPSRLIPAIAVAVGFLLGVSYMMGRRRTA